MADATDPRELKGSAPEAVAETLATLIRRGFEEAEVYCKRGRSRRLEVDGSGHVTAFTSQEEGWAIRAGDAHGSWFLRGTGAPPREAPWPQTSGPRLRLPVVEAAAEPAPARPEGPLLAEGEARALLEAIARELQNELPGAKLSSAVLEEGLSESELGNSRGVRAAWSGRGAALRLEASAPDSPHRTAILERVERQALALHPGALARRLADRLHAAQAGAPPERDRGEMLLAPAVAARLLAGLLPALVGTRAAALAERWRDARGRIGSELLSIADDGGRPGALLQAPVDGEGVPTREIVLVEAGVYRQPLVSWQEARPPALLASGCSLRPSWRDLPRPGPTHLFVVPQPETGVAALLNGVARGFYLLDTTGWGRVDFDGDRFALPVCGFAVQSGRATAPVGGAWLCGSLGAFLRGIQGVARDLTFFPLSGLIGAPSLLVVGLEIRREPPHL